MPTGMVKKYVTSLEGREINSRTGDVWKITDVPVTWRRKVEIQIIKDGYTFLPDGTVDKVSDNKQDTNEEEVSE